MVDGFAKPEDVIGAHINKKISPFATPEEVADHHVKRAEEEGKHIREFKPKI